MSKKIREDHIFKIQFEVVDGTQEQNRLHQESSKKAKKTKKPKN